MVGHTLAFILFFSTVVFIVVTDYTLTIRDYLIVSSGG